MDIEQTRQLARDETTSPEILAQLATNKDYETRQSVAANPNTPTETLLSICVEFPNEVINNSVVPLLLMENPLVFTCKYEYGFNFAEIKHLIDIEMKRLNLTKDQGRNYVLQNYGKKSRLHLSDEELLNFLYHLRSFKINNLPPILKTTNKFTEISDIPF